MNYFRAALIIGIVVGGICVALGLCACRSAAWADPEIERMHHERFEDGR